MPDAPIGTAPDPEQVRQQTKRGCLIYFGLAVMLMVLALAAILFFAYGDRPLLFMEPER